MPRLLPLLLLGLAAASLGAAPAATSPAPRPNIVLIYADDIGWGDLGCYGAKVIPTPNIDRLAAQGLRRTSAYCTSATCTPSRYSMLTGEYAWRRKGTGVLPGDAPLIVPTSRPTVATALRDVGYATAVVGKWHLGLGPRRGEGSPELDWNRPIAPGPREVGFGYSFIMAATGDRVPCVYVEDGGVVGLDPADPIEVSYRRPFPGDPDLKVAEVRRTLRMDWSHGHNEGLVNGVGRIGWMRGGKAARWDDAAMGDVFADKAAGWIAAQARAGKPFFLYYAAHENHVPRVVHPRHAGRTPLGPRGDAIVAFDEQVGRLLAALDQAGVADRTLVVVTSDNGPVLDDGYKDGAVALNRAAGHLPAGPFRGGKYSQHQGGTRVPLVIRWPGVQKPGVVSDGLVSQVDFPAWFARLVGAEATPFLRLDSADTSVLDLAAGPVRDHIVCHGAGDRLALCEGSWFYVPAYRSRDMASFHGPGDRPGLRTDVDQLYDLAKDPGETTNVAAEHPEVLERLRRRLAEIRAKGEDLPLPR
jgi:arylsulfatase A-like enzyme